MEGLRNQLEDKNREVQTVIKEIIVHYDRLKVPEEDKLALVLGQVCDSSQLHKSEFFEQLKEERNKLKREAQQNMEIVIENAREQLLNLWGECMISEEDQNSFYESLHP